MERFFGKFYCLFESLFGQYLAEHLWGYNCTTQLYDGRNLFNSIGLITAGISLILVLAYYYLPLYMFNHPRTNRWWNWLAILFFAGVINFFIGYSWTINEFLNGNIGDCLMYTRDDQGNIIAELIHKTDCWLFGLSNFFVSTIFFVFWSMIFKWWSQNCKHSPLV